MNNALTLLINEFNKGELIMEWTKYTTKEALKDNDELMILDTDGKANKRTLMDNDMGLCCR